MAKSKSRNVLCNQCKKGFRTAHDCEQHGVAKKHSWNGPTHIQSIQHGKEMAVQNAAKKADKQAEQAAKALKKALHKKAREDAQVILQGDVAAAKPEGRATDPMEALKHDVRCLQEANKILASRAADILQKMSALGYVAAATPPTSVKVEEEAVSMTNLTRETAEADNVAGQAPNNVVSVCLSEEQLFGILAQRYGEDATARFRDLVRKGKFRELPPQYEDAAAAASPADTEPSEWVHILFEESQGAHSPPSVAVGDLANSAVGGVSEAADGGR